MKYVFLDFDGVLNSGNFFTEVRPLEQFDGKEEVSDYDLGLAHLDQQAVQKLNRLVQPGIGFIVSSTWRLIHPLHHLNSMLSVLGFKGLLLGCTPSLRHNRGVEIDRYLDFVEHEDFVILDDDSDMAPHEDRLIKTCGTMGLTDKDLGEALYMLGLP